MANGITLCGVWRRPDENEIVFGMSAKRRLLNNTGCGANDPVYVLSVSIDRKKKSTIIHVQNVRNIRPLFVRINVIDDKKYIFEKSNAYDHNVNDVCFLRILQVEP